MCFSFVVDCVNVMVGIVIIVDQNFYDIIFYQYVIDKFFIKIFGFNVLCGKVNLRWFFLLGVFSCFGLLFVNGVLKNINSL